MLGDRPCVRQSKLYRELCGGNDMKGILGQDNLKWDTTQTQGAYQGGRAFDHNDGAQPLAPKGVNPPAEVPAKGHGVPSLPPGTEMPVTGGHRRGAGQANRQTYNILTGE